MTATAAAPAADEAVTRRLSPLIWANTISVAGDGAYITAAVIVASELTSNAFEVSTVSCAFCVCWLVCGPFTGAIADRMRPRSILVLTDLARAVLVLALTLIIVLGHASIAAILVVTVLSGIAQTIHDPAASAIIRRIAGSDNKETLMKVNGRYWAGDRLGRDAAGPPLGSASLSLARMVPFASDVVSFLVSAVLERRLPEFPPAQATRTAVLEDIRDGARYAARTELRVLYASICSFNFSYAAVTGVFVLWAREVLGLPPAAYGLLFVPAALVGAGTSWKATPLLRRVSARRAGALACLVQALAWTAAVVTRQTWAAVTGLVVIDIVSVLITVGNNSAYQAAPAGMVGRVSATGRIFSWGGAGVGALFGGAIATRYGLAAAFVLATGVCAVAGLAAWPWWRAARQEPAR